MKLLLQQMAGYNCWANHAMADRVLRLTQQQQRADGAGSFPSLQKTMLHMYEAENIWWRRLQLEEHVLPPGSIPDMPTGLLVKTWLQQSSDFEQWVQTARPEKLEHVIAYHNSKKVAFKQPVYQILVHLFNHQTYHRGQMVAMMHQLGIDNIPPTDFIVWSRKNKA